MKSSTPEEQWHRGCFSDATPFVLLTFQGQGQHEEKSTWHNLLWSLLIIINLKDKSFHNSTD